MIQSQCRCGATLFFDSESCGQCGATVGFELKSGLKSLHTDGVLWRTETGEAFRQCRNTLDFKVCNWLIAEDSDADYCAACSFNRTIPDQSKSENWRLWWRLENAKKRMLFGLYQNGLWPKNGWSCNEGLLFDFIEDGRSNWDFAQTFVTTGFAGGVITLNVLEADDVARKQAQEELQERYRTLLGHFRHEIGHYFWARFAEDLAWLEESRLFFGDERTDYQAALETYYAQGGAINWHENYISRYASAHPVEDWAETWAHYLHMMDALDTAHRQGFIRSDPFTSDFDTKLRQWCSLSVALNELNRAVGHNDAYPFVIAEPIAQKLEFIDQTIRKHQVAH
jgi:hypothetical protein